MTKPLGVFLQLAGAVFVIGSVAEGNWLAGVVGVGLLFVGRKPAVKS